MIVIKRVRRLDDSVHDVTIDSNENFEIDAQGKLLLLPALIDPHVHFRVPGFEYKEDWISGAQAAIYGGVTTVFDMPNNNPPCNSSEAIAKKREEIDKQLAMSGIPLRYHLYLEDSQEALAGLGKLKKKIIALKTYMKGDDKDIEEVFRIAAQDNVSLMVHLEDTKLVEHNKQTLQGKEDLSVHSKIYSKEVSLSALRKAIELAERYKTEICVLQVTTKEELDLIREAKEREILIYCEVTPHHLFLTEEDYLKSGSTLKTVPPLRSLDDQKALWEGLRDGSIDFIGSSHSPHTYEEKQKGNLNAPNGVPEIETMLPLLLNAYHEKKITLEKIVQLTHLNIENMFGLGRNSDAVLVDLELVKTVSENSLKTKCGWSPYTGRSLKGWPVYTIIQGKVFHLI